MTKELQYGGYTAQPSDYDCKDGELASVLNLIPERGAIRPIADPGSVFNYHNGIAGARVWFVHETHTYKHFIGSYQTDIQRIEWITIDEVTGSESTHPFYTSSRYDASSVLNILQINAIGNVLIILTSTGMHYFLWQESQNTYEHLGTKIPETVLSFGLQGEVVNDDFTDYYTGQLTLNTAQDSFLGEIDEDNVDLISNAVLAQVNKFIAEEGDNAGRFIMPFFVRYAYRLYDESLIMHSSPIFMVAASDTTPIVGESGYTYSDGKYTKIGFKVLGVAYQMDYAVKSQSQINALLKWKDIIRSIDIFISAPIYKYNPNGKCKKIESFREENWYCVCKHTAQAAEYDTYYPNQFPLRYQKHSLYHLREMQEYVSHHTQVLHRVVLPERSDSAFEERAKECHTFYFLKSIGLDELTTERTIIDVANDYLPSLEAREVMSDDYDSHDELLPGNIFDYNSRLNMANLKKKLFRGAEPLNLINYTDGYVLYHTTNSQQSSIVDDTPESLYCCVYIKQDGKELVVQSTVGSIAQHAPICYFYFPNSNAYKVLFVRGGRKYEEKLSPHPFLNGAVFFGGFGDLTEDSSVTIPSQSTSLEVMMRNKIYTSEVDNPFYFPSRGVNTVGTGTVLGMSTAAKALSQGQFGQYPLYAFTSDGVWALEVSKETGGFSARQPISRDVCINADSITQLDSAVLFASERGIMHISGSQIECITDSIDNKGDPFILSQLPLVDNIKGLLGITPSASDSLTEKTFRDFLSGCQMIYAYTRQAVIVFNKNYNYAYLFSLESKSWGMFPCSIMYSVPSYPEAYAQLRTIGDVVDYAQEESIPSKQFLITRPLKLDASDILKTVNTIIQRGVFSKGHVKSILYGSRDLKEWFPVWTSQDNYLRGFRGTPYKYFRIALVCSLTHGESITGATIEYTPRLTNKHR